jgi:hypothetical protein
MNNCGLIANQFPNEGARRKIMLPIQELIIDRCEKLGFSFRDAAKKSGGLVSHGTFGAFSRGMMPTRVHERTIQGIAKALDVPEQRVRIAVALSLAPSHSQRLLPARAATLSPAMHRALIAHMDYLLEQAKYK